ncbi:SOS response-associated peptidase [Segetibacter koreensis]|uniref:SOS response-associated peptidase n=1 Tax=Segetibacter koreensis TaxID=398037 RepID=UPI00036100A9|nr:SOS response-associated peptidase family protein [Segetibacter koreensis]
MCHDISFSANTVEFITDLLPNIIWDNQLSIDFSTTSHVLSMSNRRCIVLYNRDGKPHGAEFEWGLIADYMNTPELIKKYRIQMANARYENILEKKSAWYRIRKQRCLVVLEGFFEHREVKGITNKIPYYVKLTHRSHMLIPGFFNYSPLPDVESGEMKGTFSIITRPANDLMKKIHNHGPNKHRMPLLMQPEQALKWIREDLTDEDIKAFVNYEIPVEELDYCPVYTIRTTKERPDGKGKKDAYEWSNLPALGTDEVVEQRSLF